MAYRRTGRSIVSCSSRPDDEPCFTLDQGQHPWMREIPSRYIASILQHRWDQEVNVLEKDVWYC